MKFKKMVSSVVLALFSLCMFSTTPARAADPSPTIKIKAVKVLAGASDVNKEQIQKAIDSALKAEGILLVAGGRPIDVTATWSGAINGKDRKLQLSSTIYTNPVSSDVKAMLKTPAKKMPTDEDLIDDAALRFASQFKKGIATETTVTVGTHKTQ
jgi:hypothetical protein